VSITHKVLELFDRQGWKAYPGMVSMAERSDRAAGLARKAGASDAVVIAALFW